MSSNNATYIPYFVLQSYMLVYDYSWEHIIIMFLIIASQLQREEHPSRILVATFVFGYMMCMDTSYRLYDVVIAILYVYKYAPRHITMVYGTICVISMIKSLTLSLFNMHVYVLITKIVCILCCIEYNRLLEIMKNDPSQSSNNVEIKRYMMY